MLEDQKRQPRLYQPGPYWAGYSKRVTKALESEGLAKFRSSWAIGKGYADCLLLDPTHTWDLNNWKRRYLNRFLGIPKVKRILVSHYLRQIEFFFDQMKRYRDSYYEIKYGDWFAHMLDVYRLPETLVGSPSDVIDIDGTTISRTYFEHLARIHNFSQRVDFRKVRVVFEIGGGFGATAHLLIHLFPNIRKYLYLDIPPILYVGTQYLKHFFSSDVVDYEKTGTSDTVAFSNDDNLQIICICPWQIESVKASVDLFWNSASFQEMDIETVRNYAGYITRFTQGNENAALCLWGYGGGDPKRTLLPEQVIEPFADCFEFEEVDPHVAEGTPRYLLGTPTHRSPREAQQSRMTS